MTRSLLIADMVIVVSKRNAAFALAMAEMQ